MYNVIFYNIFIMLSTAFRYCHCARKKPCVGYYSMPNV